uniref:Uncharacterized protein n=1 Tax=Arundo donax TaxID=35708 RepID=A0A0A9AHC6_ARUDO
MANIIKMPSKTANLSNPLSHFTRNHV